MSGICGIVQSDTPIDRRLLARMTEFLRSRGPDAHGEWAEGSVGLGHTLLRTTLDSTSGTHPCTLDGQVWVTADARIDGQAALLGSLGLATRGAIYSNDADLILRAYAKWGEDCVQHLIGDFAFAVWDGPRQRLFCARDHFGIKPFFYSSLGTGFALSNTLNCLRLHPFVSDTLDDLSIADFLLFGQFQEPAATAFADVRRLPPGHSLSFSSGSLSVRRYWSLPDQPTVERGRREAEEGLRTLLETAISDRLRTDSVAFDMSGGLDSTAIAALVTDMTRRKVGPGKMAAYTTVHDPLMPDQERKYSTLAAAALGLPISHFEVGRWTLFEHARRGEGIRPEPRHFPQAGARLASAAAVAREHRVALTGFDGDMLLSESPKPYFRWLLSRGQWPMALKGALQYAASQRRLLPLGLRDRLFGRTEVASSRFPDWLNRDFQARLGLMERWSGVQRHSPTRHPTRPYGHATVRSIAALPDIFESYDPGDSGRLVEYRHPLLDLRVVEYCLSLPAWPWCVGKALLRTVTRGLLPDSVRLRPKSPLRGSVVVPMLRENGAAWVDDWVAMPGLERYVDTARIPSVLCSDDPVHTWDNLRPLSLNFWLQSLAAKNSGETP